MLASSFLFCPLCSGPKCKKLGIRGNHEYFGSNSREVPHYSTDVVECRDCGFIFCHPTLSVARELEEAYYRVEFHTLASGKVDNSLHQFGMSVIRRHKATGRLLDVGAGRGELLNLAIAQGYEAIGIEPSAASREFALEVFGLQLSPGVLAFNYPLPDTKFEVVTMFHVLEHLANAKELLATVKSRMRCNGILYVEVPNGNSLLLRLADFYFRIIGKGWSTRLSPVHPPFHSVAYSSKSLRYLLESSGFLVLEINTHTHPRSFGGALSNKDKVLSAIRNFLSLLLSYLPGGEVVYAVSTVSNPTSMRGLRVK